LGYFQSKLRFFFHKHNQLYPCFSLDADNQCEICDSFCSECRHQASFCTKCKEKVLLNGNYTKLEKVLHYCATEQQKACGNGMYYDENYKSCKFCDITCIECNGPTSSFCTKCPSNRRYLQNQVCVVACDDGTYLNETAGSCFP
jgi:proprotein convertase subtilisin/kexin type 5